MGKTMLERCEVLGATPTVDDMCRKPAPYRYPASGGGFMHLCEAHVGPHLRYCERWNGWKWEPVSVSEDAPDGE